MECSLPMDGRRVSLTQLSKDSFRECQASLTLTDLLIIIFSGISVSVVAIMTSFFLASTVHCFQRWSKGTKGDEEESEEWCGIYILKGPTWAHECVNSSRRTFLTIEPQYIYIYKKKKQLSGCTQTVFYRDCIFGCETMWPLFKAADSWIRPTGLFSWRCWCHMKRMYWQLLKRLTRVAVRRFCNVISNSGNICMFSIWVLSL